MSKKKQDNAKDKQTLLPPPVVGKDPVVKEHAAIALTRLLLCLSQAQDVDLILVDSEGLKVSAHRCIFNAVCPGFSRLLAGGPEVSLASLHPSLALARAQDVAALVAFVYTGRVTEVQDERVPHLLFLASLVETCGALVPALRARVSPSAAPLLFRLSVDPSWNGADEPQPSRPCLRECLGLAISVMLQEFERMAEEERSLKELDEKLLAWLLHQDKLNVRNEDAVLLAVLRWAEVAPQERTAALTLRRALMPIRFPQVSEETIGRAFWRLSTLVGARNIDSEVEEAMAAAHEKRRAGENALMSKENVSQGKGAAGKGGKGKEKGKTENLKLHVKRNGGRGESLVVLVGGCREPKFNSAVPPVSSAFLLLRLSATDSLSSSSPPSSPPLWVAGPPLLVSRKFTGCAAAGGRVWVAGGQTMVGEGGGRKLERLRSVESFACTEEGTSPLVAQWRKEPEMLEARSGLAVAELNGFLYAVGGNDGRQRLRSGERLDGREEGGGGWMGISPMLEARSNSALVAVGEKLFVMGGFDGRKRLTSMEVYDVKQNAWRSCASMRNAREGLAAVVVRRGAKGEGKDIFAIGGFDGERVLRSVERYVVEEDRWEEAEAMTRPRAFLGAFASGGRVFACGGQDDDGNFHDSVEMLPPSSSSSSSSSWSLVPSLLLPSPCCSFATSCF